MAVMITTWIFDDGFRKHPTESFPYAFRFMFNALKHGAEKGMKFEDMIRRFEITGPTGRSYSYHRAKDLATEMGLLTPDGTINSREFKRK